MTLFADGEGAALGEPRGEQAALPPRLAPVLGDTEPRAAGGDGGEEVRTSEATDSGRRGTLPTLLGSSCTEAAPRTASWGPRLETQPPRRFLPPEPLRRDPVRRRRTVHVFSLGPALRPYGAPSLDRSRGLSGAAS